MALIRVSPGVYRNNQTQALQPMRIPKAQPAQSTVQPTTAQLSLHDMRHNQNVITNLQKTTPAPIEYDPANPPSGNSPWMQPGYSQQSGMKYAIGEGQNMPLHTMEYNFKSPEEAAAFKANMMQKYPPAPGNQQQPPFNPPSSHITGGFAGGIIPTGRGQSMGIAEGEGDPTAGQTQYNGDPVPRIGNPPSNTAPTVAEPKMGTGGPLINPNEPTSTNQATGVANTQGTPGQTITVPKGAQISVNSKLKPQDQIAQLNKALADPNITPAQKARVNARIKFLGGTATQPTGGAQTTIPSISVDTKLKPEQQVVELNKILANPNLSAAQKARVTARIKFLGGKVTATTPSTGTTTTPTTDTPTTQTTPPEVPTPDNTVTPDQQANLDAIMKTIFPDPSQQSDVYNQQVKQGQSALDRMMAARGLTASGTEIAANNDLLSKLGAEDAQRRSAIAENNANRMYQMQLQEALRKERVGSENWNRLYQTLQLMAAQSPMGQAYGASGSAADLTTGLGNILSRGTADLYNRSSIGVGGGGGGGSSYIPGPPPAPPYYSDSSLLNIGNQGQTGIDIGSILSGIAGSIFK